MIYLELIFVVSLTIINGVFAMCELAMVSSRKGMLDQMAEKGSRGAKVALKLIDDPSRFLSTVQVGITLIGILTGAFGGATLAGRMAPWLDNFPDINPHGETIAVIVVVFGITYLSLVVGELVPKRIALSNPERIAAIVARPMLLLSKIVAPAVWLLKVSTEGILNILGLAKTKDSVITEEEVKALIAEGAEAGVFMPQEHEMLKGVMRLGDRPVRAIVTPRNEIASVDISAGIDTVLEAFVRHRLSRMLVCEGGIDHVLGVINMKDMVANVLGGQPASIRSLMMPVLVVPERTTILRLIDILKREKAHIALVVDEYGTTEGVVTITDILESIAGNLPDYDEDEAPPQIIKRADGSLLVDGSLSIEEFEHHTALRNLQSSGNFHTVAGFALQQLGHVPKTGEMFVYDQARYEIVDMDGRRIDKVLYVPADVREG